MSTKPKVVPAKKATAAPKQVVPAKKAIPVKKSVSTKKPRRGSTTLEMLEKMQNDIQKALR